MIRNSEEKRSISNPTTPKDFESTYILGVRVDKVNFEQALLICRSLIDSGLQNYVVTPNPEIVMMAERDLELKKILNKSDLSIPDGLGMVVFSNLFGDSLPERVSGVDLLDGLAALSQEHGFRIFLLGGGPGVSEKASEMIKKGYPKLRLVGTFAGDGSERGDREILEKIGKQQIDILAVAFGPGKQERWIERNLPKLDVRLAIGVGGALDLISGQKKRAPLWMQRWGLEWAFRLFQEPWRAKRQLALPEFAIRFVIEKLKKASS